MESLAFGIWTLVKLLLPITIVWFLVANTIKIVPQQTSLIVERLGKYHATLLPGLNLIVPFIDVVAYKHSLKETAVTVPAMVAISKDNTQLKIDAVLYLQITDPKRASYGSSNYLTAVIQLAQTTLRSVIGKMELDKALEARAEINAQVVAALDEAAGNWGVKLLRAEISDITPPQEILHAMQMQIQAERTKRAKIAASEGTMTEQMNLATGERNAAIARSEGQKQAAINRAQAESEAIRLVADATAESITKVAQSIGQQGGEQAVQLKVAELAIGAYASLAKTNNTMIVPADMAGVSGLVASAMAIAGQGKGALPVGSQAKG